MSKLIATFALILAAAPAYAQEKAAAEEPKVCTQEFMPVCATDIKGKRRTYSNKCFATVAHATDIAEGDCDASK